MSLVEREPEGYSIDSRTVGPGELFFAIRGERFDGHEFVSSALERGAIAAVVSRHFHESAPSSVRDRLIPCDDTLIGLQSVASFVLESWTGREVAITGSMGKTTAKDLTALTLEKAKHDRVRSHAHVMKTLGNLNNAYGLPLSILRMETKGSHVTDFDYAVFEMGMSSHGEIRELTRIAPPDIGVVTVVAPVHLEFFSSADEIAKAKSEMVVGIKSGGIAVLNADDPRVARMRELRTDVRYRTFGLDNESDFKAVEVRSLGLKGSRFRMVTPSGEAEVTLPLPGRHNVYNAMVAVVVGDACGAALSDIASALSIARNPKMRGEIHRLAKGVVVVDDSYNSNPNALIEMARTLAGETAVRRILVAGEMLELGEQGPELHRDAGRELAKLGFDRLIGVRGLGRDLVEGAREAGMDKQSTMFCETSEDAAIVVERMVREGDAILVKGSRGVKTEVVVQKLIKRFGHE